MTFKFFYSIDVIHKSFFIIILKLLQCTLQSGALALHKRECQVCKKIKGKQKKKNCKVFKFRKELIAKQFGVKMMVVVLCNADVLQFDESKIISI